MKQLDPWERMKDESEPAYEAFVIYRNLGFKRTQVKVIEELKKSPTLINRWAQQFDWQTRALEYDRELDRQWMQEQHEQRRKIPQQHAAIANSILLKVAKRLQTMTDNQIAAMTPVQLGKLFATAVKVQRESYGLGPVIDLQHSGEVNQHLDLDFAQKVLDDPTAADLSLALAVQLYGEPLAGEPSTDGNAGNKRTTK